MWRYLQNDENSEGGHDGVEGYGVEDKYDDDISEMDIYEL